MSDVDPRDQAIYEKYGVTPKPAKKPKKRELTCLMMVALLIVGSAILYGVFQVNPICGVVLLFFGLPLASNLWGK